MGIPTRVPCKSDELDVLIVLDTDNYGHQTIWEIIHNGNNDIIKSGDGYERNQAYEIAYCLSNKIEYTFTIYYNWSNDYQLKVDGNVIASGDRIWQNGESTVFGSFAPTASPIPTNSPTMSPSLSNSC